MVNPPPPPAPQPGSPHRPPQTSESSLPNPRGSSSSSGPKGRGHSCPSVLSPAGPPLSFWGNHRPVAKYLDEKTEAWERTGDRPALTAGQWLHPDTNLAFPHKPYSAQVGAVTLGGRNRAQGSGAGQRSQSTWESEAAAECATGGGGSDAGLTGCWFSFLVGTSLKSCAIRGLMSQKHFFEDGKEIPRAGLWVCRAV